MNKAALMLPATALIVYDNNAGQKDKRTILPMM
jgi:hypothetical protein